MVNNYNKDLYKILNITSNADISEIKAAYRKLVRLYHPDVAGKNADENKFKEIQKAYEVLSNEDERKKYDIVYGFYRDKLKNKRESENSKYNEYIKQEKIKYSSKKVNKENKQEKKESFTKSINEALDNLFHGQNNDNEEKQNFSPINGEDIKTDVTISLIEAINGTTRKVNILHTAPCPTCNGKKIINGADCIFCKGLGQIQSQKKINVKIPPSVKNGAEICIKNEGNSGINGGKNGDLYLVVNIEKNKYFSISGNDILITLPLTPYEAALGTNIQIKILNDNVNVKIPKLTSSGQKLRLIGLGLENIKDKKNGDVIITIMIKMPKSLSNKEIELYKKLKELNNYDVRKDFK